MKRSRWCRATSVALAHALASLAGCSGGEKDTAKLFFQDELVAAPVRQVEILALSGVTCEALLAQPHEAAKTLGEVVASQTEPWRENPGTYALTNIPRGMPVTLEVATYDADHLQVARGCHVTMLDPSKDTSVDIELRSLPFCESAPTQLDILILMDMSLKMEMLPESFLRVSELYPRVVAGPAFPAGTRFSLVTYGRGTTVTEVLAPEADLTIVKSAIESLHQGEGGPSNVYDGVSRASSLLRSRALCGRKSAQLIIAGSTDQASTRLIEDASLGVIATRSDPTDDLFTYGLAFSTPAYDELSSIVPEAAGFVTGAASSEYNRKAALTEAGRALRALVP